MEPMQQPVGERREHHPGNANEGQAGKKRITGSENFRRCRLERIDRSHSAQNHGGIEQGIDPAQMTKPMIAEHTDSEGRHRR